MPFIHLIFADECIQVKVQEVSKITSTWGTTEFMTGDSELLFSRLWQG